MSLALQKTDADGFLQVCKETFLRKGVAVIAFDGVGACKRMGVILKEPHLVWREIGIEVADGGDEHGFRNGGAIASFLHFHRKNAAESILLIGLLVDKIAE